MPVLPVLPGGDDPPIGGLRLQILGTMRLRRAGAELDPGPRRQALLLALLLAHPGQAISTADLIDMMWGDDVPASALNIIQKYVGALRRILEPTLPVRGVSAFLHHRDSSYLFTVPAGVLDLSTFREQVDAAGSATARQLPEAALDHYAAALGLWRGPAGNGIADGTTAMPVFAALNDEFTDACAAAAGLAVSLRRPEEVLPALRLAVSMAPFHEPVQAGFISLLGAAGRQAEALSLFHSVRDRLADELGVDPGPALQEAFRQVLTPQPPSRQARTGVRAATAGLVGRTEELSVLRDSVEQALAGRTAIAFVEGEPGVGKTRLLQEAAAVADRHDALVVWGSCLEGDGTPSMWPWVQALGAIVDTLSTPWREKWSVSDLGGLLEPGEDGAAARTVPDINAQFRLFEQVVALIGQAASQRPMLLVLDDLQWADAASLQLLGHVAARQPDRTAVIGAFRDRAPRPGTALSQMLAAVSRQPGHSRFRLGPLGLADVAELVRHESGHDPGDRVARTIHTRTAGNPFFVRELSRLLRDGEALDNGGLSATIPSTVRDVVRDRMTGLDEDTRDLLHVAALIGRDIDLRLLSRAAGVEVADCLGRLEPLYALGLLETGPQNPSSSRFAHDLVRESVAETTTRQHAVRLHLRVADALEAVHADDEVIAERLAHHLWAAGPLADPGRTAEALVRAGRCAASKLAFQAADRQLRLAAQLTRTAGLMELELSVLTLLTIVVRRHAGYGDSTFELLERAEYLARSLGREAEAADFLFIRMMGAYTSMSEDRGRLARRMHDHGQSATDPTIRRYGRHAWGLHQWDIGNIAEAHRAFTETGPGRAAAPDQETPLRRDGGIPGEGPGWRAVMTALHGDPDTALAYVDTWDDPGDPYAFTVWVYYTTMIASMAGDAAVARRAGERWAAADPGRLRTLIDHYVRQFWCWARALTGDDPTGAAREAERCLAADLLDPPQWGIAYHYGLIAEMWLVAGMPDRTGAALDRAERALATHGQRYAEGLLLLLRARLLDARGEPVTGVRAVACQARTLSARRGAHLFARRAERFVAELDARPADR
nr:BTAD domain-containing putative transcriptional regulator [Micromonospora sp. DSM 115978]